MHSWSSRYARKVSIPSWEYSGVLYRFYCTSAHQSLILETRLFQRAPGISIIGKWLGIDSQDICGLKDLTADLADSVGHNPLPPIFFGQIILKLGCLAVDIILPERTDAADGFVVHSDGKSESIILIGRQHGMDVICRVVFRVGIRQ